MKNDFNNDLLLHEKNKFILRSGSGINIKHKGFATLVGLISVNIGTFNRCRNMLRFSEKKFTGTGL
jgi:hypothetical protein